MANQISMEDFIMTKAINQKVLFTNPEFLSAISEFLDCFEVVFGDVDWPITLANLQNDARFLIHEHGTFIDPGVKDENANWHNRGSLLTAYRALLVAMSGVECSAVNIVTTISLVKAGDLQSNKTVINPHSERNSCHAPD